eukprot:1160736-Pelagomonas_calceolata.AAC.1
MHEIKAKKETRRGGRAEELTFPSKNIIQSQQPLSPLTASSPNLIREVHIWEERRYTDGSCHIPWKTRNTGFYIGVNLQLEYLADQSLVKHSQPAITSLRKGTRWLRFRDLHGGTFSQTVQLINFKGDTLAQKSCESPPPQGYKSEKC